MSPKNAKANETDKRRNTRDFIYKQVGKSRNQIFKEFFSYIKIILTGTKRVLKLTKKYSEGKNNEIP